MGGKKKTKWRKLPLEEFTREIPIKPDKVPQEDVCQTDLTNEESSYIPSYNETLETAQQYVEPYEYTDGLWYPTSCVVYNPAEVGMYSNYMMPVDTCYYYYTMPEIPPVQDYLPVPYQDFSSQLPKDTVYLLLPPQTLRPSQPVHNIVPEWQNRRRRRRYEGYADYAIIPEKANKEEKDRKKSGPYSRRNSNQSNNFRRMTSFSDFDNGNSVSEQNQSTTKFGEMKKPSISNDNMHSDRGQSPLKDGNSTENNQKLKKNLEMCGVHSKSTADQKESIAVTENFDSKLNLKNELQLESDLNSSEINEQKTFSSELFNVSNSSQYCDTDCNLPNESLILENEKTDKQKTEKQFHKTDDLNLSLQEIPKNVSSLQNINQTKTKPCSIEQEIAQEISEDKVRRDSYTEDIPETTSQSSLPDILSTLNKSVAKDKLAESDLSRSSPTSADISKGISSKPKSLLSHTSDLPYLFNSETLNNELELELKQLNSLHSLQANTSIYKLAYDESITDQSEVDSRSPSPMDPESHVPTSLTSNEIIIHEADSSSEAGSEDVELIPHRYESESFLNVNKHVYINKLSLAVELLRTQEALPYDDEFKRIVGENNVQPVVHTGGKVNRGFIEDSCSPNAFSITDCPKNNTSSRRTGNSSSDSAIFSDNSDSIVLGFDDEQCEEGKEAIIHSSEDNTEEVKAGYRRFGVQAGNLFSSRAAFPLSPRFCCIVM